MFEALRSALREAGGIEGTVPSASFVGASPVGMFRVRRKVSVKEVVRDILEAVLSDDPVIGLNGIRLKRPKQIQILMTEMRKWEFTPDFPVDAAVVGISVDVSVRSIELVRDDESGFPALLITTASSVKPDVMLICELESPVEDTEAVDKQRAAQQLFDKHAVPQKYRGEIQKAVGAAWGRKIAQTCIASEIPIRGQAISIGEAESVATMIVQDLVHQQVVGAGLFFWMYLGYWLVKIITALIQLDNAAAGKQR